MTANSYNISAWSHRGFGLTPERYAEVGRTQEGTHMAHTLISMELEGLPPTVNNYYGRTGCTVYKKTQARQWQEKAVSELSEHWGNIPPYSGAVDFHIVYLCKDNRKWDIDN